MTPGHVCYFFCCNVKAKKKFCQLLRTFMELVLCKTPKLIHSPKVRTVRSTTSILNMWNRSQLSRFITRSGTTMSFYLYLDNLYISYWYGNYTDGLLVTIQQLTKSHKCTLVQNKIFKSKNLFWNQFSMLLSFLRLAQSLLFIWYTFQSASYRASLNKCMPLSFFQMDN